MLWLHNVQASNQLLVTKAQGFGSLWQYGELAILVTCGMPAHAVCLNVLMLYPMLATSVHYVRWRQTYVSSFRILPFLMPCTGGGGDGKSYIDRILSMEGYKQEAATSLSLHRGANMHPICMVGPYRVGILKQRHAWAFKH